ncbi:MAG: hypothetical protein JWR21_2838 [Herminiimonas sp.]|jgi:hypothetical protein|nr:hypothetical protein [Herminiimonas sp.]
MARRTRKTAALPTFQIKTANLPGSVFYSYEAFAHYAPRDLAEREAIADYRIDGDRGSLHIALGELDWDYASIEAVIAAPQERWTGGLYDVPLDFLQTA